MTQKILPGVKMPKIRYYLWNIERWKDGFIHFMMVEVHEPMDKERAYKVAPTHKKFVSDGVIVYMTCDWTASYTDEWYAAHLREWKKGNWKLIDLRSERQKRGESPSLRGK